ncbi:MAG: DinB family protein [Bacteroidetes bacterium]|nr:MAG: DinB family protein [Bacteroidota bacterium]
MKGTSSQLINDLEKRTRQLISWAESLQSMDESALNRKEEEGRWSVLECLEHLNRYGDFYLPEIQSRMETAAKIPSAQFKSSWLGEYFADSMIAKEKLNAMKTFKSMNPMGSSLTIATLNKFIEQQHQMLRLLHNARSVNLSKVKTSISISKFIKLRLGDTFRVVIYHNERHRLQADKVLANTSLLEVAN